MRGRTLVVVLVLVVSVNRLGGGALGSVQVVVAVVIYRTVNPKKFRDVSITKCAIT